ncbi:protein FAM171A1-like, partial [Scleropages formosus]
NCHKVFCLRPAVDGIRTCDIQVQRRQRSPIGHLLSRYRLHLGSPFHALSGGMKVTMLRAPGGRGTDGSDPRYRGPRPGCAVLDTEPETAIWSQQHSNRLGTTCGRAGLDPADRVWGSGPGEPQVPTRTPSRVVFGDVSGIVPVAMTTPFLSPLPPTEVTLKPIPGATVEIFANHTSFAAGTSEADGNAFISFPYHLGTPLIVTATKPGYVPNSAPWWPARLPVFSSLSLDLLLERAATLMSRVNVFQTPPSGSGRRVELAALTAISVHLRGSDGSELHVTEPVNILVPLPSNSGLKENDHIPAWRFDPKLGEATSSYSHVPSSRCGL